MSEPDCRRSDDIKTFWRSRAGLERSAGTRDLIAKELETRAISRYITDGMRILDAGCGNGVTAVELAKRYDVHIKAFDFAEEMVEAGRKLAEKTDLKGSVTFEIGDVRDMPGFDLRFDMVYTERVLINLPDWSAQASVISAITRLLVDGGAYVMCENSQEGLEGINRLRAGVGLSEISAPWHNRYLRDAEIEQCRIPHARLEKVEYFTSTYHFLSRVVNAWLAQRQGKEPSYDAPVNRLALQLPPIGELGQTRIWVWRKTKDNGGRS